MIPAVAFAAVSALLVAFQLALALGARWGAFAWGGQHAERLPTGYRIASATSIVLYAFLVSIVLDRGGVIALYPAGFSGAAIWVVFGFLALGIVMNALSRSRRERAVMTPVATVLAGLALLVALL